MIKCYRQTEKKKATTHRRIEKIRNHSEAGKYEEQEE